MGALETAPDAGVPLAPREAWPAVLRDAPWRRKGTARRPVVLDLAPIATPFAHDCAIFEATNRGDTRPYLRSHVLDSMGDLAAHIGRVERRDYGFPPPPVAAPIPEAGVAPEQALAWLGCRLAKSGAGLHRAFYRSAYGPLLQGVAWQPEPLALLLWELPGRLPKLDFRPAEAVSTMVARFGERAMPGLAALVARQPADVLPLVATVDAAELVPVFSHLLVRTRSAREGALGWLRRHRRTAAMRLLPDALGPLGPTRQVAEQVLRVLLAADAEMPAILDAAVAAYAEVDPRVPASVAVGLDADPLEAVPARAPKPPAWVVAAALPKPRLSSGGALPDAAVTILCEMLAFSSSLAPYAGVAQVRAACAADSLDDFALALFHAWVSAGANAASDYATRAMQQIGGAECAREVVRQAHAWIREKARTKALAGVDALSGMDIDVALMSLNAVAGKSPFARLRARATARIAALAEARGLTEDELGDRLTPDLGLDADGGLDLSFGPRSFRVGFDEMLKPWLRDAAGRRLVALPRPGRADDAVLAKAAARRLAGLRRDAAAVAGQQIARLEAMMSDQRRVTPDVFRTFFVAHPVMRHLARRLVWGRFEGPDPPDRLSHSFRIAEGVAITDADDRSLALDLDHAASGVIGPIHPLHLTPDTLARWSTLFAEYEILQPFPQLGRETFAIGQGEAASPRLVRFDGARVAGRRLRGLRSQGWTTEGNSDLIRFVRRPVRLAQDALFVAVLDFETGFSHHPAEGDGIQTLRNLTLRDDRNTGALLRFGDLDVVTASEILRAPSLLAGIS